MDKVWPLGSTYINCVTYNPPGMSAASRIFDRITLDLSTDHVASWAIFLHPKDLLVPSVYVEKYGGTFIYLSFPWENDTEFVHGLEKQYSVFKEEMVYLDTESNRCNSTNTNHGDTGRCLEDYPIMSAGCVPPWTPQALRDRRYPALKTCDAAAEYKAYREAWRLIKNKDEQSVYQASGCMPNCKWDIYKRRQARVAFVLYSELSLRLLQQCLHG